MNTRLAQLLTGFSLLAIAQACTVQISDNDGDGGDGGGHDCGSRPAIEPECGTEWVCEIGEWVTIPVDDAACAACPNDRPVDGAACPSPGLRCDYEEYYDCGEGGETVTTQCTEDGWVTFWPRCSPAPECPESPPEAGTDCSDWPDAWYCDYATNCGPDSYLSMHCELGVTPPTWVVDGAPNCGGCESVGDADSCAVTSGCQWLEPGCAEDPAQLITAGCYPIDDCLVTDDCGEDETCAPLIYNPCFDSKCGACGAEYNTCVPATPGG